MDEVSYLPLLTLRVDESTQFRRVGGVEVEHGACLGRLEQATKRMFRSRAHNASLLSSAGDSDCAYEKLAGVDGRRWAG